VPAIIIHNGGKDTAAFVATIEGLNGLGFTEIKEDGTTTFMQDRDDLKLQIRTVINEVMGLMGFRMVDPKPKEQFTGENETTA
jgi:hypothetical protein